MPHAMMFQIASVVTPLDTRTRNRGSTLSEPRVHRCLPVPRSLPSMPPPAPTATAMPTAPASIAAAIAVAQHRRLHHTSHRLARLRVLRERRIAHALLHFKRVTKRAIFLHHAIHIRRHSTILEHHCRTRQKTSHHRDSETGERGERTVVRRERIANSALECASMCKSGFGK